jgi:hypothetical protein
MQARRVLSLVGAQARAEAGGFGGGGRWVKFYVLGLRRTDRTDRAAIDVGRTHAREETTVVAAVATAARALAFAMVEREDGV